MVYSVGTSVEHHTLYQYELSNTRNIFLGHVQSETAYYQPSPNAPAPFTPNEKLLDHPACSTKNGTGQCSGWGLRILDSQDIGIYGAGLYSFFNNYNNCESAVSFIAPHSLWELKRKSYSRLINGWLDSLFIPPIRRLPKEYFQHRRFIDPECERLWPEHHWCYKYG